MLTLLGVGVDATINIVETPRTVKPVGNPVTIDWANPQTQGLVGLWDLQEANPTDVTGVWGDLVNGIPGSFDTMPNGVCQTFTQQPGGGLWTSAAPSPLESSVEATFMAAIYTPAKLAYSAAVIEAAQLGSGPLSPRTFAGIVVAGATFSGYPDDAPFRTEGHFTLNDTETSAGGAGNRSLNASTYYHIMNTMTITGAGRSTSIYINGAIQGTGNIPFTSAFTTFDTMGVGARLCLGNHTQFTGTFTNGSNIISGLSAFAPVDDNVMYVTNGPAGVPALTYTVPNEFPLESFFMMSAVYTGTTTTTTFNLTGPKAVGNLTISLGAVWKVSKTAPQVATNYADPLGFVIYQSDLDQFTASQAARWLQQNNQRRASRVA